MTENWAALFFLWKPFNALAEAVRFLTILPVPSTPAGEVAIARSTAVFPLVGLLLGGGWALPPVGWPKFCGVIPCTPSPWWFVRPY